MSKLRAAAGAKQVTNAAKPTNAVLADHLAIVATSPLLLTGIVDRPCPPMQAPTPKEPPRETGARGFCGAAVGRVGGPFEPKGRHAAPRITLGACEAGAEPASSASVDPSPSPPPPTDRR